ncbi:MAG: leucyl aminopeptidase [Bryobacteraceae bacterium]
MEIEITAAPMDTIEADALAVVLFEREEGKDPLPQAAKINQLTAGWVGDLYASGEFKGKMLETALHYRPAGLRSPRLLVIGGGKQANFGHAELRRVTGAAARLLRGKGCRSFALALEAPFDAPEHAAASIEGAILGDYEPDRYKTQDKDERKPLDRFFAVLPVITAAHQQAAARGRILAESQNFTRDLVNEPANHLPPLALAERARQMATDYGLECEILDRERMAQLGMGALLGVAAGSQNPPALIILRYRPEGPSPEGGHLGLVGKGVTFDSGGISIKPSDNMDKMKYDMAGGAAVLGVMRALAQLKPAVPVTALVPATENMPGGRAQRPGDIVTTLSGKTVEVLNTDAEGRLILADAITYARRLGCTHLVDVATLTGAIVVALGYVNVGVFSNNDELRDRLLAAAKGAGEKMWPMPLDEEYKGMLKSAFADIPNVGNRWGGAITAAMFLKEFVESTPWVHLDIAGTAWLEDAKPFMAKGPTGVTVRTLAHLALEWGRQGT